MRYLPFAAWMFAVVAVSLGMTTARGDETVASVNGARFEAIKKLAGDWVEVGKDGKPGAVVVTSIKVTAAGSAVEETLFPGTPKEMVTMYHRDGAELVLTHYCAMGNQPRMKAEPGSDASRVVFQFDGGTNLKSEGDVYMSQASFTLTDQNRYRAEWVSCKEGSPCHKVAFDLVRKAK